MSTGRSLPQALLITCLQRSLLRFLSRLLSGNLRRLRAVTRGVTTLATIL